MKKIGISGVLFGLFLVSPHVTDAAYPVYSGYQPSNGMVQTNQTVQQGQMIYLPSGTMVGGGQMAYPNNNQVVIPNNNMVRTTTASAQPTRITGALPRVGSTNTNAGRQYYQPADFDRLADSGLYIGVSAGYSASIMGSVSADYQGEENSWFVPGAFQEADFASDTVIPLQLSVGAAINNDIRVDFSFLRYSGLEYPNRVQSSDGAGGFIETSVTGGAITANATMLNVYYNIDSYTGYLAGGMLRPYIGAGVGISLNTIADYVVYDNTYYAEVSTEDLGLIHDAGVLTGISDIYAYHNGGTEEQFAFMLEGGVTTELEGGLKMDFFVRYANLGRVKTSGSIIVSQTEWLSDGAGNEYAAPYDSVFHYTNWYESGRLGMVDVGVRLRLQF